MTHLLDTVRRSNSHTAWSTRHQWAKPPPPVAISGNSPLAADYSLRPAGEPPAAAPQPAPRRTCRLARELPDQVMEVSMRIGDIMSTPVHQVHTHDDAAMAWELMHLHGVRHLVVSDSPGIVMGVISAEDLGGRAGVTVRIGRRVADLMSDHPVTVTPDATVREAANLMRGRHIGCLPVVSHGRLKGIITRTDLLDLLGRGAERPVTQATRRILKDRGPTAPAKQAARRLRS
jgi:acetoin utilization protein AcuB